LLSLPPLVLSLLPPLLLQMTRRSSWQQLQSAPTATASRHLLLRR
jgi:hypothetical protein